MSKTMAPGLRIGWLVAPPAIRGRCVSAKAADDMACSAWIQEVVAQYLANGRYEEHVPRIRAAYGLRCDAMGRCRASWTGACASASPRAAYFWARLTGEIDATRLLPLRHRA